MHRIRALLSARKTVIRLWLLCIPIFVIGCGIPPEIEYLITMGVGQLGVVTRSIPLKDAIDNPDLAPERREKLLWVEQARDFAQDVLGLSVGESYRYYYDTGDGPAVYNLSASRKDVLDPYTWEFPIAGQFQYLGYFDLEMARNYAEQLKALDYDTVIYGAVAYSTGGIFRDPLYSSLLELEKPLLADTVIHELTHNTVFGLNNNDYTESIATFVGKKGAREFIKSVAGEDSDLYRQTVDGEEDRELVNDFLAGVYDELAAFYARTDLTSEDKVAQRETIFQAARDRFAADVLPKFHDPEGSKAWGNVPTNNAWILLNRRYHYNLDVFERVLELNGGNLTQAILIFKQAGDSGDPYGYLQEWIASQGQ